MVVGLLDLLVDFLVILDLLKGDAETLSERRLRHVLGKPLDLDIATDCDVGLMRFLPVHEPLQFIWPHAEAALDRRKLATADH
jgi:hypothetical protein